MNEWGIYIALYCAPKAIYNHVGGLSLTTPSVQHPLTFTFMDLADSFIQSAFTVHSGYTFYIFFFISMYFDDATAATGQQGQCAHHTPATGGEERES